LKTHLVIVIALLLLAACSKPAPPPKHFDQLKVTYKKDGQLVQRQIPMLFALLDSDTVTRSEIDRSQHSYGTHRLCLANYDVSESPEKPNANLTKDVPPEQDLAPVKACLTINDKDGTDASSPFQPGTYFVGLTAQMPNRISAAAIHWDKRRLSYAVLNLATMTGSFRLDSLSDDAIIGEINISDGENSVAGTFNVKPKITKEITLPMQ